MPRHNDGRSEGGVPKGTGIRSAESEPDEGMDV
jgi:hypothetical protein